MIKRRQGKPEAVGVAVVIVNYATPELTMRSVAALAGERGALPKLQVIVVDGGSPDQSATLLGRQLDAEDYRGWVSFLPLALNGGFGWANNQAILRLALESRPPQFIHLLNPDTEVTQGAVAALVDELLTRPDCAVAGSQLLNPDETFAASAFRFPSLGLEFVGAAQSEKLGRLLGLRPAVVESSQSGEVDWVTGASFMVRVSALQESGLFDDGFFLYFEEVELMRRLSRFGWSVRHVPTSRVIHFEGASTGLGAATAERPYPAFWYQSRKRYFGLTGGGGAVIASGLSALAGQALVTLKKLAGRQPPSGAFRARDLLRWGLLPSAADDRP
jgi:N-acetylglucosaminyl-diphospho-decaprenol L-rhamnosyltransferase